MSVYKSALNTCPYFNIVGEKNASENIEWFEASFYNLSIGMIIVSNNYVSNYKIDKLYDSYNILPIHIINHIDYLCENISGKNCIIYDVKLNNENIKYDLGVYYVDDIRVYFIKELSI